MKKVELCYVDAKGVHNKVYGEGQKDQLMDAISKIEKILPNAPIRLLGTNKVTGKPLTQYRGAKFDWNNTDLTVEVVLVDNGKPVADKEGNPILFTYVTKKYVSMSEQFPVKTARGLRTAIISSECRRKTSKEINDLASALGYSKLVILQDVIVKEG